MGDFKGASLEQDARYTDKQKRLLKSMNFPKEFFQKVFKCMKRTYVIGIEHSFNYILCYYIILIDS